MKILIASDHGGYELKEFLKETFEKEHEILNEQKAKEMPNLIKIITEDDDKIYIFIDLNREQVKELANTIKYYGHTTSCPKCGNGTFYAEIYGLTKILNIVCSKCTHKLINKGD